MLSLNTNQDMRKLIKFGYVSSAYVSSGTSNKSKTIWNLSFWLKINSTLNFFYTCLTINASMNV